MAWCVLTVTGVKRGTFCSDEVINTEGESGTLSCTYDTSYGYTWFYWFRYYPDEAPKLLLYKSGKWSDYSDYIPDERFESTTSWSTNELVIKHLTLPDTGLYYCASDDGTQ
uniref:Ig-like domain-containing protein n=1 Tax=Esox lucius TaxID=8010 RepID=A0AAY5KW41_ESOLU